MDCMKNKSFSMEHFGNISENKKISTIEFFTKSQEYTNAIIVNFTVAEPLQLN